MKTTTTLSPVVAKVANSFSEVELDRIYRTRNGSIVVRPNNGANVYGDMYVVLRDHMNRAVPVVRSPRTSRFPWTPVEPGFTINLTQE